jgi:membrane fusion protein (multidrug efflux system)
MLKKILITFFGLLIVVGFIIGIKALQIGALKSSDGFQLPPEYVTSATVKEETWKQTLDAVGSLTAVQGVTVSSEVAGKVTKIHFESGEPVEEGQLLVELDITTEEAQLAAAVADVQLAKLIFERVEKLRKTFTVAESELDSARASLLSASAQMENMEAVIKKKKISAPFTGRLGIRQIDKGQFLNNGDAIVSLQSLDPIYVDFSFPQKWISLVEQGMQVEIKVDSFPEASFKGNISAINPEVAVSTRTISLRATLDNSDGKLLPGMFSQVSVNLPKEKSFIVVPATSILYNSYGDSVFVIKESDGQKIVEQHFVETGEARGDFVSLIKGPEVGSVVVSSGAFKLRHGVPIIINNDLAPKAEINPDPSDS